MSYTKHLHFDLETLQRSKSGYKATIKRLKLLPEAKEITGEIQLIPEITAIYRKGNYYLKRVGVKRNHHMTSSDLEMCKKVREPQKMKIFKT